MEFVRSKITKSENPPSRVLSFYIPSKEGDRQCGERLRMQFNFQSL